LRIEGSLMTLEEERRKVAGKGKGRERDVSRV
jgi:hypothetical protein